MKYKICCISHNRHENLDEIFNTFGTKNIYFFVKDDIDKNNYIKNGAENVIVSGKLIESRNAALDFCFANDEICIQISDDLKSINFNDFTGKRTKQPAQVTDVIDNILPEFYNSHYLLCGFPPTDNPFFALNQVDNGKFIVGDFIFIKPNHLRFDSNLELKEDYDYCLQHMQEFGGCLRYGLFLTSFIHYSNKGGAVSYRNDKKEQDTISYLINKWGDDIVKMNAKRTNEILLNRSAIDILKNRKNVSQMSLF
jgi:hypothetical protein